MVRTRKNQAPDGEEMPRRSKRLRPSKESESEVVVDVTAMNPYTIHVSWKASLQLVSGYKVYCSPYKQDEPPHNLTLEADSHCAVLSGLTPNTIYMLNVTSINKNTEEEVTMLNGFYIKTLQLHHMNLSRNMLFLKSTLNLEEIMHSMKQKERITSLTETKIMENKDNEDRIQACVEWLQLQPNETYRDFIQSLYTTNQSSVADQLSKSNAVLHNLEECKHEKKMNEEEEAGDVDVVFTDDGELDIYKKGEEGDKATLTTSRWNNINPERVTLLRFKLLIISCTQLLFDFVCKCCYCEDLILSNVRDNTDSNKEISQGLVRSLGSLNKLLHLDIRDTDLADWGAVLPSVSAPKLTIFSLGNTNLYKQGEALKALVSRSTNLLYLELTRTGLSGDELLEVLSELPHSSPLLRALNVWGHDLSTCNQKKYVKIIKSLPRLKLLGCRKSKLKSETLSSVIKVLNKDIEILSIDRNIGRLTSSITKSIKRFKRLQYLDISSSQFEPADLAELQSELAAQGTKILVDAEDDHPLWEEYGYHYDRISEECLTVEKE